MKVYIGPYKNYIGPYQLVRGLFFWTKTIDEFGVAQYPNWVDNICDFVAHGFKGAPHSSWLSESLNWIHKHRKRKIKIKIDYYDAWSADQTLSHIILPLLLVLKEKKHGAPYVDLEDVPSHLHPVTTQIDDFGSVDEFHFQRWDYVLNEMIFSFEHIKNPDWEDNCYDPKTNTVDFETLHATNSRIQNGLKLFGKYYQCLWD